MLPSHPDDTPLNEPIPAPDPAITFAYTKLLWDMGEHREAAQRLEVLRDCVIEPTLRMQATQLEENGVSDHGQASVLATRTSSEMLTRVKELKKLMAK